MSELSGERVRLDRWLWAARFFKTRALAAAAIAAGRVAVNGARAKRAKLVAAGDQLRVRRGPFEYRVVVRSETPRTTPRYSNGPRRTRSCAPPPPSEGR